MATMMRQLCSSMARRMVLAGREGGTAAASSRLHIELCGRGDKKMKRGKHFKGSYGNTRPKREKKIERIKHKVEVTRSTTWPLPFKLI